MLEEAVRLFDSRTMTHVKEIDRKNFRVNNGEPKYTFGIKEASVVCMWIGNFRKDRIGRPKKDGSCTVFSVADDIADFRHSDSDIKAGFLSKEWDRIGKELLSLYEELSEA